MSKDRNELQMLPCLIKGRTLTRIAVSDKPPALGGVSTYLTPEELGNKFKFIYSESLFNGVQNEIDNYVGNRQLTAAFANNIDNLDLNLAAERLSNPLNCFVIAKIGSYDGSDDDVGNQWFIGEPIKVFYSFKQAGIWRTEEATKATEAGQRPGDIKIEDVNGRGTDG